MVKISQNINSNSAYVTVGGRRGKYAEHLFFYNGCPFSVLAIFVP